MNAKEIANSPVLIVAAAGAGLAITAFVFATHQRSAEVVGGSLPFSWDALENWLRGRNGGPGPPQPEVLPQTPCNGPLAHLDPKCQQNQFEPITPYVPGLPSYTDPNPLPRFEWGDPGSHMDSSATEKALVPEVDGMGGGYARAIGLSPETLYAQRYSLAYTMQQLDRPEEASGMYGYGH